MLTGARERVASRRMGAGDRFAYNMCVLFACARSQRDIVCGQRRESIGGSHHLHQLASQYGREPCGVAFHRRRYRSTCFMNNQCLENMAGLTNMRRQKITLQNKYTLLGFAAVTAGSIIGWPTSRILKDWVS